MIASDDNGETWFLGGRIPFGVDPFWRPIHGNEATVSIREGRREGEGGRERKKERQREGERERRGS